MSTVAFKTSDFEKKWFLVDVKGLVLGRVATKIASILRGKHKPQFTPNHDMGDHVIVINSADVVLTAGKATRKHYYSHSGYIGGLKDVTAEKLLKEHPERLITYAVTGMLPKTTLGKAMAKKLRVYAGASHPHQAQGPIVLTGLEDAKPN